MFSILISCRFFLSAPEALISKDKAQAVEKEKDQPLSHTLAFPVKEGTLIPLLIPLIHWGVPEFWEGHVLEVRDCLVAARGDPRTGSFGPATCPAASASAPLSAARSMYSKRLRGKWAGIRVRKCKKLFDFIPKICYMEFNWSSQCTGGGIEIEFFTQHIFHRMN